MLPSLNPLGRALISVVHAGATVAEIRVKSTEGKLLTEIHRGADVLEQKSDGLDVVLRGLDSILMTHLRKGGVSVTAARDSPGE